MTRKAGSRGVPAFEVNEASDLPLWIQLKDRISYLIISGYYQPDDQLPSVRRFAAETHISYNTVSKAYMALEREGYVITKQGSGVYVSNLESDAMISEIELITEEYIRTCLEKGMGYDDIPKCVNKTIRMLERANEDKKRL